MVVGAVGMRIFGCAVGNGVLSPERSNGQRGPATSQTFFKMSNTKESVINPKKLNSNSPKICRSRCDDTSVLGS